jgi:hypothetical protein
MRNRIKLFLIGSLVVFITFPSSSYAGLFDNLLKEIEKNIPVPGKNKPAPGTPENIKKVSEEGKIDYSSSSAISFLCQKSPPPGLTDDPAPNPQLVADDFGKTIDETIKILHDNFSKPTGPLWAKSIPYYADAFDRTEAKLLFNAFVASSGRNLDVLSQLKIMSSSESNSTIYTEEFSDASFAYGIILSHYQDFHNKKAYAEGLLDSAMGDQQLGAAFVYAKQLYYGWGVPRNVNKSADWIQEQSKKEKFNRATELWHEVALDPEYKYRNMSLTMTKMAGEIKAGLRREMNKKSSSVLRSRINRLNNVRIESLKKLATAFNLAEELGEIIAEFEDLKNKADQSNQLVEKSTRIGDKASKFMSDKIAKSTLELDPNGQRLVKEAFDMNRQVIAQLGVTIATFMSVPGPGTTMLSDLAALAPALDRGVNASCQLNEGIVDYGKKKNVSIDQGDIKPDEEDEFKE